MSCCPTCGRPLPRPKPAKAEIVDTAIMSDADLFAYYRKTAPIEDLRFFLRHAHMSPGLRADAEVLLNGPKLPCTEHYQRLRALQDRWRRERNDADRAAGIPAIGAPQPEQTEVA
jgi:hypothetical protein